MTENLNATFCINFRVLYHQCNATQAMIKWVLKSWTQKDGCADEETVARDTTKKCGKKTHFVCGASVLSRRQQASRSLRYNVWQNANSKSEPMLGGF